MMRIVARRIGLAVAVVVLIAGAAGRSEAGITLNFESVPYNHTSYGGPYSEIAPDGFRLIAMPNKSFYTLNPAYYPESDTGSKALYSYGVESPFATLAKSGGGTFTLNSIDLSELSKGSTIPGTLASFTGYRADGSSISQTFALDGVFGMQTFTFTGFTDMAYVRFSQSTSHQFDNIRLDYEIAAVPEPSTLASGILGVVLTAGIWLRRRRPS